MPDINMQHFEELQRNQHSIDVEIDASQVASPQQDFPMMLETPNSSNSRFNVVAINEFGEQLPTEIEGVANDKNWIHLKDIVQDVMNRKMKVFYGGSCGKPAADSTYGSEAVWNSNISSIWLFNNDPSTSDLLDSTDNDIDGAMYGSMTSEDLVDGKYGKEIDFVTDDYFSMGAGSVFDGVRGFVAVMTLDEFNAAINGIFGNVDRGAESGWGVYTHPTVPELWFDFYDGSSSYPTAKTGALSTGVKYHISGYMAANSHHIFVDSVDKTSYASTFASYVSATASSTIGDGAYSGGPTFDGQMSYLLFSKIESYINQDFITTSYNNLNNPTASGNSPFYRSISKELNFVESLQSLGRAG